MATTPFTCSVDEETEEALSPEAVKALRTHEKAQHTRQVNRVRGAIRLRDRRTILKGLRARLTEHFENGLALNEKYQNTSGQNQDGWAQKFREEHMACKRELDEHLAARASSIASCSSMNSLESLDCQDASQLQRNTLVKEKIVAAETVEVYQQSNEIPPSDAHHEDADLEGLSVYLRRRDAQIEKLKAQLEEQRVLGTVVERLEEGQEYLVSLLQRERDERRALEARAKVEDSLRRTQPLARPDVTRPTAQHPGPSKSNAAIPRRCRVTATTDDDRWIYEEDEQIRDSQVTCRAPKLDITKFDGDPKNWPMFISSFRAMIDSMRCSDAIKLTYLKELLTDEVRKSIAGTLCRPALYRRALEELHRKYGHPFLVARAYTDALLAIEPMRKEDNAVLRRFAGEVHETVSTLVEYNFTSELDSGGTLSQLVDKLPERFRDKWGKRVWKAQPEILNLVHFDIFLEELVMSRKVVRVNEQAVKPASSGQKSRPGNALQPRVHNIQQEEIEQGCEACTEPGHLLKDCSTFEALSPDKRLSLVKDIRLCFSCLGQNHRSRECRQKTKCDVEGCERKHHQLLHGSTRKTPVSAQGRSSEPSVNATQHHGTTMSSLLPVVPVCIRNGTRTLYTHALLDPGSDRSLIRSDAVRKLRLKGPNIQIRPHTFHGQDPVIHSKAVNYSISSVDGTFTSQMKRTLVVPRLTGADRRFNLKKLAEQYDHLKDLPLPSDVPESITLLLGTDALIYVHEQLATVKPEKGTSMPAAVLTPFGWTLFGPAQTQGVSSIQSSAMTISAYEVLDEPDELVKTLWDTDLLGITAPAPQSAEDQRAVRLLEETTRKVGNRYEAGLLWKQDKPNLPNNYGHALHRLLQLERRLAKDPRLAKRYEEIIGEYVKYGFARVVEEPRNAEVGKVWYLPHHAVVSPHKSGKVRVVFDAWARHQGTSLNDALLKGPDLSTNLSDILLKFRLQQVAVAADVDKMYHQVRVRESDQSALRFLWRSHGSTEAPATYQMMVHVFGAVSSPTTCIMALQRTAKDHRQVHPEAVEKMVTNVYADNFLDSCATVEEAERISLQMTELLAKGGFLLTKWISTSRSVMEKIPKSEWLDGTVDLARDPLPTERILGLWWSSQEDVFLFRPWIGTEAWLKREILSEIAKVNDPLGFLAPVVLFAKILLQTLWRHGTEWNEEPPPELLTTWQE